MYDKVFIERITKMLEKAKDDNTIVNIATVGGHVMTGTVEHVDHTTIVLRNSTISMVEYNHTSMASVISITTDAKN